jgi:hypothetical protein
MTAAERTARAGSEVAEQRREGKGHAARGMGYGAILSGCRCSRRTAAVSSSGNTFGLTMRPRQFRGLAMVRTRGKALACCQYLALLACIGGMVFCWANAALHLYGPSPLLSWASADIDPVLGVVAYGSGAELATNSDGTTADPSGPSLSAGAHSAH